MLTRLSLVAIVVSLALPAGASGQVPILAGPWASDQRGYGHVEPNTIYNGGDPTGLVRNIEWDTWGGAHAIGKGSGFYVSGRQVTAEGRREPMRLVAFHLGCCHGRRAYDAIEWYFPQHGEHFNAPPRP